MGLAGLRTVTKHKNPPFIHNTLEVAKITAVTKESGERFYTTPEGNVYPSATTVLAANEGEWLDDWRARVGETEAAKVSGYSTRRGKTFHGALEAYIKNQPIDLKSFMPDVTRMLSKTLPVLESINIVYLQERSLWSDVLKLAGTPDLVCTWKDKPAIVDFKNSKRRKALQDIDNYFVQCLMYAYMCKERFGMIIRNGVIIMAVEDDDTLVFEQDLSQYIPKLKTVIARYEDQRHSKVLAGS